MAENDGQGQACRQCGQPCDNLAADAVLYESQRPAPQSARSRGGQGR